MHGPIKITGLGRLLLIHCWYHDHRRHRGMDKTTPNPKVTTLQFPVRFIIVIGGMAKARDSNNPKGFYVDIRVLCGKYCINTYGNLYSIWLMNFLNLVKYFSCVKDTGLGNKTDTIISINQCFERNTILKPFYKRTNYWFATFCYTA